jgi:hypothetical protein
MKLTKFQKNVTDKIKTGEIKDIKNFADQFADLTPSTYTQSIRLSKKEFTAEIRNGMGIWIFKNEDEGLKRFFEFVSLCDYLESNKIITKILKNMRAENDTFFANIFVGDGSERAAGLMNFIENYLDYNIAPLPGINEFIERNYLTTDEYNLEQEKADRQNAQRITVGVAIFTVVASAFINYLIYSKDRNVTIMNKDAFKDTIKVVIVKDQATTSLIKDGKKN